ncbi:MAG: hypothetical protein ABWY12_10500, partial [Burkholderiales bacterium]
METSNQNQKRESLLDVARKNGGVQPKTQAVSNCYFLYFKPRRGVKKGPAQELASRVPVSR